MVKQQQAASTKPMFDSAEIEGIEKQDFRSDESIKLKQEVEKLWQVVHQKGLEVGEPSRIMELVAECIDNLNRLSHIIDEGKWKAHTAQLEEEISKLYNKADYGSAYHKRTLQAQELERGLKQVLFVVEETKRMMMKVQDRVVKMR